MDSRYAPSRRPRWGTLTLIVVLHLAALAGLATAFAPGFAAQVIDRSTSLVTVTVTTQPDPPPTSTAASDAGVAGQAAPEAPLPRPSPAPRVASTGVENSAGADEQDVGSGAGGEGTGPGSGGAGAGRGGGARPLELIAGRIDNARDYPTPPGGRGIRRGHDVVIELTVGTDGRVSACRITDPSPDPAADAITCRLATERFVFRPRLDDHGQPAVGIYRWRQRWF